MPLPRVRREKRVVVFSVRFALFFFFVFFFPFFYFFFVFFFFILLHTGPTIPRSIANRAGIRKASLIAHEVRLANVYASSTMGSCWAWRMPANWIVIVGIGRTGCHVCVAWLSR